MNMEITKAQKDSAFEAIKNTLETHQFFNEVSREVFEHGFLGFGTHKSRIRVHIYRHDKLAIVVFEDLGHGTSVTNASELLATEIGALKGLDPQNTAWLECYPYNGSDFSLDRISYTYDSKQGKYHSPNWGVLGNVTVAEIIIRDIKRYIEPR